MHPDLQQAVPSATRRTAWLVGAICLVVASGCAHKGLLRDDLGYGMSLERKVLRGMGLVEASTAQRQTVLAAFDRIDPELRTLAESSQQLQKQWQQLNAGDAAFPEQSAALIDQRLGLMRRSWELETEFDQTVAAVLDAQQWATWHAYVRERSGASAKTGRSSTGERGEGRRR